jgi:hypothetical protein
MEKEDKKMSCADTGPDSKEAAEGSCAETQGDGQDTAEETEEMKARRKFLLVRKRKRILLLHRIRKTRELAAKGLDFIEKVKPGPSTRYIEKAERKFNQVEANLHDMMNEGYLALYNGTFDSSDEKEDDDDENSELYQRRQMPFYESDSSSLAAMTKVPGRGYAKGCCPVYSMCVNSLLKIPQCRAKWKCYDTSESEDENDLEIGTTAVKRQSREPSKVSTDIKDINERKENDDRKRKAT